LIITATISHFGQVRVTRTIHTRAVSTRWRVADGLTGLRLLLIPGLWLAAVVGNGRVVGIGLLVAGATDFLDGYLARRLKQESARGARLDALADNLLLISAAAWIQLLHPEILADNRAPITATACLYVGALSVGLVRFRRLGNLHLYSSKAAGGLLYSFGVITLVTGAYDPPLLWLAAAAFALSSAETLVAHVLLSAVDENVGSILVARRRREARMTIQAMGSARNERSQAPHPANAVGSNASATSRAPTSATPKTNEMRP
jgi:phosphatidylglycerophosphate synthase